MHQKLAIILQQFNYGKNSFIELVPDVGIIGSPNFPKSGPKRSQNFPKSGPKRCQNFPKSGPKRCHSSFYFKRNVLRISQQVTKTFGYF